MDNNDRPAGSLISGQDTQIQLVVNRPENAFTTIDLGRVFRRMKQRSRLFAWVLVLCMVVGITAPLLMYQFQKKPQTMTSVVTLRYDAPNPAYLEAEKLGDTIAMRDLEEIVPVYQLITPEGEDLDLGMVTASSVLKEAVGSLTLSVPVTLSNLRSNITVTRVLTEESSRAKEVMSGLKDAKSASVYERLETTEIKYQNRFVVSLTNGFGDEESQKKVYLTSEELQIVLNRILDAYNSYLVKQYADVRLPEDRVSTINPATQDLPEVLDSLHTMLDDLYTYCEERAESVRTYRSWQTGMTLNDWMEKIRTVQTVVVDYLDAGVYSRGEMRNRDAVIQSFRYRQRLLQVELDEINKKIESNNALLKNYQNSDVLVSMQESDTSRSAKFTTDFYNQLIQEQQETLSQATLLRTEIATVQEKIDRLSSVTASADISGAEADVAGALETVRDIQDGIRTHMIELFDSPLYTTYSEHSAPQSNIEKGFLATSSSKMIIGAFAGAFITCAFWFLSALIQEFGEGKKENGAPKADADGKEAAEA